MSTLQKLLHTRETFGAGYWVLLDPDKLPRQQIGSFISQSVASGVDAFLIGGSLLLNNDFDVFVKLVKETAEEVPVVLFPGSVHQITPVADAILFLSLVSGREAQHLIGSQVLAAPLVYHSGLEAIGTAYMLIDSGHMTSAQFMSGTMPLPRNKPDIVVAHALAAKYLGFKMIYLEGGSGAEDSVPEVLIQAVTAKVDIPVIVGGGIRRPEEAAAKVKAGASFVVTGNILEGTNNGEKQKEFAKAIHFKL